MLVTCIQFAIHLREFAFADVNTRDWPIESCIDDDMPLPKAQCSASKCKCDVLKIRCLGSRFAGIVQYEILLTSRAILSSTIIVRALSTARQWAVAAVDYPAVCWPKSRQGPLVDDQVRDSRSVLPRQRSALLLVLPRLPALQTSAI